MTGLKYKSNIYFLYFLGIMLNLLPVDAQVENYFSGVVVDAATGKQLAFVNISYNDLGKGTTSNIDGVFELRTKFPVTRLKFSYIGYETVVLHPGTKKRGLIIRMQEKAYNIDEIKISPGENPAHRIIDLVYKYREINNPEKIRSFSYTSYNKLYFTLDLPPEAADSLHSSSDSVKKDTVMTQLKNLVDKQHLFLMESVSKRDYIYPDKNYENVVASKVSGFQRPSFILLASQLQSFSFYNEFITIFDHEYLSPISKNSTKKYLFILRDTLFTEANDTLFIISFQPRKGKNFEGLKGFMYVNSKLYGIQNVVAEAAETRDLFKIKIQQKYEFLEQQQWFPVQLNTNIILTDPEENKASVSAESEEKKVKVIGIGKSYIQNITLYPDLDYKKFNSVVLEVNKNAHNKNEDFWRQYRNAPLSARDSTTYQIVDSLGKAEHFDRMLFMTKTLINGYIPVSIFNIDIGSILNYNSYEGFRLGIGGITNEKLSDRIFFGGHFAYGFKDKRIKYGLNAKWVLSKKLEMDLQAGYLDDVKESASYEFYKTTRSFDSDYFRQFLIEKMDRVNLWEASFGFRMLQYVRARVFFSNSFTTFWEPYLYNIPDSQPAKTINKGTFTETGIRLRFAYKEKFFQSPRGRISLGIKYPVFYGNYIRSLSLLNGEFNYSKFEFRLTQKFTSRSFGTTSLSMDAGLVKGETPYSVLYNGRGSYKSFTIETENSFGTMRMNEFLSDRFFSFFFRQNFGKLLFKAGWFQPDILFVSNLGVSYLSHPEYHSDIQFKIMDKGYYESGILINNLLNQLFIGYGLGVYYRYGPYTLPKTIDNFAFKFTLSFKL